MESENSFHGGPVIFTGFLCYWSVFFYLCGQYTFQNTWMEPKVRSLLQSIIVSITHGLCTVFLSAYWIFSQPKQRIQAPTSSYEAFVSLHCVSYFLIHIMAMNMWGILEKKLIIHHLISIVAVGFPLFAQYGGYICLKGLLFADVTNFAMNLRIILKEQKLRYTKIYQLLDTYYIVLYLIVRIFLIPICIFYPAFTSQNVPFFMMFISIGLLLQSLLFSPTMLSILNKKINTFRIFLKQDENSQLRWLKVNPRAQQIMCGFSNEEKSIF